MPAVRHLPLRGLAAALLVACTDVTSPSAPAGVVVLSPDSVGVVRGTTFQFTAAALDSIGGPLGVPLRWSSSDTTVATVSAGNLTARALGVTWIIATAALWRDSAFVRVVTPAASVSVTPVRGSVLPGATVRFDAAMWDSAGHEVTSPSPTWSTLDTVIATVTSDGVVVGRAIGRTAIFATANGVSGAATVDVVPAVATVGVRPSTSTIVTTATLAFVVTAFDSAGHPLDGRPVLWLTSDSAVATVAATGLVTAHAPGRATITARIEGRESTAVLDVATLAPTSISASLFTHSCAVNVDGRAFCWGSDSAGQLGNGQQVLLTTTAIGVASGATFGAITTGYGFSCALATGGMAFCWGRGRVGQLGNGSNQSSNTPVAVSGGIAFRSIGDGASYACGLATDSSAYCWGDGDRGVFGDGTRQYASSPVPGASGLKLATLSSGWEHVCAVTAAGVGYCWGSHETGQVGDGTNPDPTTGPDIRTTPQPVTGGLTFRTISAGGDHSCGITTDSLAYCWGANDLGQLGTVVPGQCFDGFLPGWVFCSVAPVPVSGAHRFVTISAGAKHTCAFTETGVAYCWGGGNAGELGNGTNSSSTTPVPVSGGLTFASISAGSAYTCGITTGGLAYCWGSNLLGRLGTGSLTDSSIPLRIAGQP